MNVVETSGLGKRYGNTSALHDCTMAIPAGHVVALVGPNGSGKSTLLNLVVGLAIPTAGSIAVLDGLHPASPKALEHIAFVAQDAPTYRNLSTADTLHLTRNLNRTFDQSMAERRLANLGIPLRQRSGRLSGGQKAQLALTLALARHPRLLVLDEPVASLDPLARSDFMATVLSAVAEEGMSVLFSSHVLADLERMADYLVLLSRGRVQLAGDVDDLLATHVVVSGPTSEIDHLTDLSVIHVSRGVSQSHALLRATRPPLLPVHCESHRVGLEELAMAYLREPDACALPGPDGLRSSAMTNVTR